MTSRSMSKKRGAAAVLMAAALVAPTLAHHSFAMFDQTKTISQKGVVKEVEWKNPHVWLVLGVQDNGKEVVYRYEGAAIAVLKRVGWMRDSVKPGDVVTVVGNPYKDGRTSGGALNHLILADGSKLGTGDAIPGALAPPADR